MVKLKHVQQDSAGKCGVACLEMIFKHYKIPYKKDDIWDSIKTTRPGKQGEYALTHSLAEYSIRHGLNATVYKASADTCFGVLDRLEQLNIPAILSVRYKKTDFGHFIVYSGQKDGGYLLYDPDLEKAPVRYNPSKIREQWSPNREVTGFVYVVFEGDVTFCTCMQPNCRKEYPILVCDGNPYSNKVVCPHCNSGIEISQ